MSYQSMVPASTLPHIVIVGAGFAGLTAARALKNARARITVIDRGNHHLFQPLLYQVATAGLSPANIAMPIRSILRKNQNTEVVLGEVLDVDPQLKTLFIQDRQIFYDYLVLATGAQSSYFGHDSWENVAPSLKSISDATRVRKKILLAFETAEMEADPAKRRALLRFVIVGGGPTGVEMAGSIAELAHHALARDFRHIDLKQTEILLVEAGPRILASFPESLSIKATRALTRLGVQVRTGNRVEDIDSQGVTLSGTHIAAKTVIWAAGVRASPAGNWLKVETDSAGRVKVQEDLSIPRHPEVFVIGDTACKLQDGQVLPGVCPVAIQQGKYVASLLRARVSGGKPLPAFRYLDKGNLATIGRSSAVADLGRFKVSGFFAWLLWLLVHILFLIGFRNRILVILEWAWAYVTFQRGARLIVVDTGQELP